ncbi:sulfatase-like hydrolase/transferase [Seonamhaeicola maritimus]|uniref:Sulfatase-like hydrolase/transferase n=1 Tax=Seonamhaeicola maritimus TaxID=2591822 RepID=A0A5C7GLR0_9FLAO|nr:sulfatase-like hydrolase/transferase [Seonamhaeicola maritimus]TXG39262.1 sulfatase-like hydrolase/transferase [Seonamhaeicola maritimus]
MRAIIVLVFFFSISTFAQPNIILIESDDQSNLAVGAYGFDNVKTPNIDSLAESGVYFTNAYNMGCWSPAVCIPSRTMLFNGVHLWEASKINKSRIPGPSLTERLKDNGYETYFTGKWHAWGKSVKETFNHYGSILPGQLKTYNSPVGHYTDIVGNEAVSFINDASKKDNPFFLYVAFNAPHVPRQTEQRYYDMYPKDKIKLPPSVKKGPLHPHIKYNYTSAPLNPKTMQGRYQQNNAMVTHMDDRIGEILEALKKQGLYENSIIIFMSDHGISFGENGVAGKVCLYDVSAKAPLIIMGPGIPKDKKLEQRLYLQDIYPTILDFVGADIPEYIDFKSLKSTIKKASKEDVYNSIYLAMFDDQRSIIQGDYKLIMYPKAKAVELYNLKNDKWETDNLIADSNSKTIVKKLLNEFVQWQKETGDELDIKLAFPEYFN